MSGIVGVIGGRSGRGSRRTPPPSSRRPARLRPKGHAVKNGAVDEFRYCGRPVALGLRVVGAGVATILSAGLLAPLGLFYVSDYLCKHSELDGHRFVLRARPLALFGECLFITFLGLITLGLYLPFGLVRLLRFLCTHVEHRGRRLAFAGDALGLLFVLAWGTLLSLLTLGLLAPWCVLELFRYVADRVIVGPRRFDLDPPLLPVLGRMWPDVLLCILSLGLYLPWALDRQIRLMQPHLRTVPASEAPAVGIRAPALALVAMIFCAGLLFAYRHRHHLPLGVWETALVEQSQAAMGPTPPPEGGRVSGAGASGIADEVSTSTASNTDNETRLPVLRRPGLIAAPLAPVVASPEAVCCTDELPPGPEVRAVTGEDGTLTITNRDPSIGE